MQTFLKLFLNKQNATDLRVYSRTTTIIIEPAGFLYQLSSTLQVDRSSVFLSNFHAAASFSASVWLFVSTRWRLCLGSGRTGHGRLSKGYHVNVRQYLQCFVVQEPLYSASKTDSRQRKPCRFLLPFLNLLPCHFLARPPPFYTRPLR